MEIVILGSGPLLSRSIAEKFGSNGFNVVLVSRREENLIQEVEILKQQNIKARYTVADLSNKDQLDEVIKEITEDGEKIPELIVFNPFVIKFLDIEGESWESIKEQMDINVGSAFNLTKYLLPIFKDKNKGKIIYTGGGLALEPVSDVLGLSMTKAALRNFVYAMAQSVKDFSIQLSTVTIKGTIGGEDPVYHPDLIAERYWDLYNQNGKDAKIEIIY